MTKADREPIVDPTADVRLIDPACCAIVACTVAVPFVTLNVAGEIDPADADSSTVPLHPAFVCPWPSSAVTVNQNAWPRVTVSGMVNRNAAGGVTGGGWVVFSPLQAIMTTLAISPASVTREPRYCLIGPGSWLVWANQVFAFPAPGGTPGSISLATAVVCGGRRSASHVFMTSTSSSPLEKSRRSPLPSRSTTPVSRGVTSAGSSAMRRRSMKYLNWSTWPPAVVGMVMEPGSRYADPRNSP